MFIEFIAQFLSIVLLGDFNGSIAVSFHEDASVFDAAYALREWVNLALTCTTGPNFDAANPVFDSAIQVCAAR